MTNPQTKIDRLCEIMPSCYRCDNELSLVSSGDEKVLFFSCPACNSRYARNSNKGLHDRWGMPLTLPLYDVIFDEHPAPRAVDIAQSFVKRGDIDLEVLIAHIDDELANPKQRLSAIHNARASEFQLRGFLSKFRDSLVRLMGEAGPNDRDFHGSRHPQM